MRGHYTLGEKAYIGTQIFIISLVAITIIAIVAFRMIP